MLRFKRLISSLSFRINITLFITLGILGWGFAKSIIYVVNMVNNSNRCITMTTIVAQAVDAHLLRIENAVKAGALSSQTKRLTTTNSKQLCDSVRAIANLDSVYIAAFRSINPKIESRLKYVWEHHESTWTEPYRNSAGKTCVTFITPLHTHNGKTYGVLCADIPLNWLKDIVTRERNSERTTISVVSKDGAYIYHPDRARETRAADTLAVEKINIINSPVSEGVDFKITESGATSSKEIERTGWKIYVTVPDDDRSNMTLIIVAFTYLMLTILFILMALAIILTLRWYLHPLEEIAIATEEISHGNFDVTLPEIRQHTDIRQLRDSFVRMQQALKQYILDLRNTTKQKVSMERDISIAAQIQKGMLPTEPPHRGDIDVYGLIKPAKTVGGDLYDFFVRQSTGSDGETRDFLFFCIGDVSGKGVPAALLMTVAGHLFRNISRRTTNAARICDSMNIGLAEGNDENMFCTLFVGVLDTKTWRLEYCNAGHTPPIMIRGEEVDFLKPMTNLPLGIDPDFCYTSESTTLAAGDTMLLYTDGVTEAENFQHQIFGNEMTLKTVRSASKCTTAQMLAANILATVNDFASGAEQSDDITMLCVKHKMDDINSTPEETTDTAMPARKED